MCTVWDRHSHRTRRQILLFNHWSIKEPLKALFLIQRSVFALRKSIASRAGAFFFSLILFATALPFSASALASIAASLQKMNPRPFVCLKTYQEAGLGKQQKPRNTSMWMKTKSCIVSNTKKAIHATTTPILCLIRQKVIQRKLTRGSIPF